MPPKIKKKTRRVALRSTAEPGRPPQKPPEHIVVEIFADGWIQFFAEDHVRFHVFNRLHIADSAMADDVDEFHSLDMPRPYRELYFSRHIRGTGLVEKRTIESEYLRRERLAMLREYRRLAEDIKKGDTSR